MTNNNKNKGKAGEREICKIFAGVFGGSWQRVPLSGAFCGGKNKFRVDTLSKTQLDIAQNDIIPPDEYPHCALEVKTRKDFNFNQLVRPEGILELNKWIDQVEESGINMETAFPLIAFKPNRCGWFLVLWGSKIADYQLGKEPFVFYKYNDKQFIIVDLNEFIINNKEYLINKFK